MAKLVVFIPEQTFEYDLSEDNAEYFREAVRDKDTDPWAFDDLADFWVSDTDPEMEVEFVDE